MASYDSNYYSVMIDTNGDIYQINGYQKAGKIGIDTRKELDYTNTISEMQETLDGYYNKLVELGVITPPKSAEEIAAEAAEQQNAVMVQMLETMQSMQNEIATLKCPDNKSSEKPANKAKASKTAEQTEMGG